MDWLVKFATIISPLVTVVVGCFAFGVYFKQKGDDKRAAANMILLEIRHIEKSVKEVKNALKNDNLNTVEDDVIREDVWSKYSHIFSKDFDNDEWEAVSNFFQNAKLLNAAVKKSRDPYNGDVAQIRINKQRHIAELAHEAMVKPSKDAPTIFQNKAEAFNKLYESVQEKYLYTPSKYTDDAKRYCDDLNTISTTAVGIKLKKISKKQKLADLNP